MTVNKTKYQLTVEYSSDRIELLTFPNASKHDEARAALKRMQTVVRVANGDKRQAWETKA